MRQASSSSEQRTEETNKHEEKTHGKTLMFFAVETHSFVDEMSELTWPKQISNLVVGEITIMDDQM